MIVGRAKAAFRAHERPPYVVYVVERRDEVRGGPDLQNSYDLKVWLRSADRSALTRRLWRGVAYGPMEHITVAFDAEVDPGPPTADVFEARTFSAAATPAPQESAPGPPIIGDVRVVRDFDYTVRRLRREGAAWHLWLEPKRDPLRNRIDELWIDAASDDVERMRVRDHLYLGLGGNALDEELDVRFTLRNGLPVIAAIDGVTAGGEYRTRFEYRVESFPATLPAWYFRPEQYGAHRAEAPE
ncbi:MAG TPA: hypothetical protein VGN14_10875 [Candidatus Elarobacter sp.]